MVVHEIEPSVQEVYHVSIVTVARLVGIAPESEEWADIVVETGVIVDEAFSTLDSR